ncbi:MAG: hypothetical protein PPP58_11800 [Natronomonas sp.]
MEDVSLEIPDEVLRLLPQDGDDAAKDMQRAVAGFERAINSSIEVGDDEGVETATDVVERLQTRAETYDDFVPELRAWGQSPAYAIAWRDLYVDLVTQLYEHDELGERLDEERNYRLVEDGIRLQDM